ncbi:hypothetical protein GKC32_04540 [Lactobacillus curvatus]|nr:hypothetical protein [Latilactobacillus curvatus]MSE23743.1 hypothetical protein [Latilactobacillus curvatus]
MIQRSKLREFLHNYGYLIMFVGILLLFNGINQLNGNGLTPNEGGDDSFFRTVANQQGLLQFVRSRYETWSSRVLIEGALFFFVKHTVLWRIVNSLAILIIIYVPYRAILKNENKEQNRSLFLLAASIVVLGPLELLYNTGWIATTLNYLWPLAAMGVALIPVIDKYQGHRRKSMLVILGIVLALYATNQEQVCGMLILISSGLLIYQLIKKNLDWYTAYLWFLSLTSFIFIITAPGNVARKKSETVHWFSDFDSLTTFRKIELGFSATAKSFFLEPNILLLFTTILLIVITIKKEQFIPAVAAGVILMFNLMSLKPNNAFAKLLNSFGQYGSNFQLRVIGTWVPDGILTLLVLLLCFSIYKALDQSEYKILAVIVVLLGGISRLIMGFTPTIWVSGIRTFSFLYMAVIIVAIMLIKVILRMNWQQSKLIILVITATAVAMMLLNFIAVV